MSRLRGFGDAMQLPSPERGPEQDNMLPLINVVFLLLIFFMLTETAPRNAGDAGQPGRSTGRVINHEVL